MELKTFSDVVKDKTKNMELKAKISLRNELQDIPDLYLYTDVDWDVVGERAECNNLSSPKKPMT